MRGLVFRFEQGVMDRPGMVVGMPMSMVMAMVMVIVLLTRPAGLFGKGGH